MHLINQIPSATFLRTPFSGVHRYPFYLYLTFSTWSSYPGDLLNMVSGSVRLFTGHAHKLRNITAKLVSMSTETANVE